MTTRELKVSPRELKDWLTVTEAAEVIGMSRQNLYYHLYDGRLRAAETKHGWIIAPESAREYAEAYRQRREAKVRRKGEGEHGE